jgi:hypothetical protein
VLLEFILPLLIADFLIVLIFSFYVMLLTPLGVAAQLATKLGTVGRIAISYPLLGAIALAQFGFWSLWAVLCAGLSVKAALGGSFFYRLLCHLIGLCFCTGPIRYLLRNELMDDPTRAANRIRSGAIMYGSVAVFAYLVCILWMPALCLFFPGSPACKP